MDNAKFHHSPEVITWFAENEISYRFLPPYSPELNPIEEFFSALKTAYSNSPRPRNTQEILVMIPDLISTLNDRLRFRNFFAHMREFIQLAYNREPFH